MRNAPGRSGTGAARGAAAVWVTLVLLFAPADAMVGLPPQSYLQTLKGGGPELARFGPGATPPVSALGGAGSLAASRFDDDGANHGFDKFDSSLSGTQTLPHQPMGAGSGQPEGAVVPKNAQATDIDASLSSLDAEKAWEAQQTNAVSAPGSLRKQP